MKKEQCERLCKQLLPQLPDYGYKDWMLYARPLKHVLRGFYFEDSGFDPAAFYLWGFCLPLYVPTTHVSFNLGKRLSNGKRWNLDEDDIIGSLADAIEHDGVPLLSDVREPVDVPRFAERLEGGSSDPHVLEAIAYSHVFANDLQQATTIMNRLLGVLATDIRWQAEMFDRVKGLLTILESEPDKARHTLEAWELETIENLGLGAASEQQRGLPKPWLTNPR